MSEEVFGQQRHKALFDSLKNKDQQIKYGNLTFERVEFDPAKGMPELKPGTEVILRPNPAIDDLMSYVIVIREFDTLEFIGKKSRQVIAIGSDGQIKASEMFTGEAELIHNPHVSKFYHLNPGELVGHSPEDRDLYSRIAVSFDLYAPKAEDPFGEFVDKLEMHDIPYDEGNDAKSIGPGEI